MITKNTVFDTGKLILQKDNKSSQIIPKLYLPIDCSLIHIKLLLIVPYQANPSKSAITFSTIF